MTTNTYKTGDKVKLTDTDEIGLTATIINTAPDSCELEFEDGECGWYATDEFEPFEVQTLYDWDVDRFGGVTLHKNWGDLDNTAGRHRSIYIQGDDAAELEAELENCDSYDLMAMVISEYFDCIEEEAE
jgi:hypothetical protein